MMALAWVVRARFLTYSTSGETRYAKKIANRKAISTARAAQANPSTAANSSNVIKTRVVLGSSTMPLRCGLRAGQLHRCAARKAAGRENEDCELSRTILPAGGESK